MKTFKQYLEEKWKAAHLEPTQHYIFNTRAIPLFPTIFKKIFSDKKIKVWHVADRASFEQLIKIQKSNKAISALIKIGSREMLLDGLHAGSGFVIELIGNYIASGSGDIWSMPDTQGRRWYDLNMSESKNLKFFRKEIDKIREKLWNEFVGSAVSYSEKGWENLPNNRNKVNIMKKFYVYIEELMKKHKTILAKMLQTTEKSKYSSYTEIVVDQFEIKKVFTIDYINNNDREEDNASYYKDKGYIWPTKNIYDSEIDILMNYINKIKV